MHNKVHDQFKPFNSYFDDQNTKIQEKVETGKKWQEFVCQILEKHSEEKKKNADHISYDLLDNNPENLKSVEALYHDAEKWIEESARHRKYEDLAHLSEAYNKVLVWYEPNFKDKLVDICKVFNKDT